MPPNPQFQIKLSQLRVLVAVAKQENFTEAASNLEMSQSAVSHAIAALEEVLGVVLFSRGRHGANLTPVGEQVVKHAREILNQIDAIAQVVQVAKGLHGGELRIASFRSVVTQLLPPVVAQFHQNFPAISIHLTELDDSLYVEQALREGRADIGFVLLPASSDLEAIEILREEFLALFPAAFQPASDGLTWQELAAQPIILPPANHLRAKPIYDHARSCGYPLQVAYEVETDAASVNLVAQGLGATILPRLAAKPIPPNVQIFPLPDPLERVIGVAVLENALHPPTVYAFLELLKERGVQ